MEVTFERMREELRCNFYQAKQVLRYLPHRKVKGKGTKPITLVKISSWKRAKRLAKAIKNGTMLPGGLIAEKNTLMLFYNRD